MFRHSIFILALSLFCSSSWAESTEDFLSRFHANPKAVMNEIPAKFIDGQQIIDGSQARFDADIISREEYVAIKAKRSQACRRGQVAEAPIDGVNNPARFLTGAFSRNLAAMEADKLTTGEAEIMPWSGDYWPIANGIIGARNFDENFADLHSWELKDQYIKDNPFLTIFESEDEDAIRQLAVSEKYELLVGDINSNLSKINWQQGREYYEEHGKVEGWMGICHGWAPASYMIPEPQHSVDVLAFDGTKKIHIYPAELKGLASYQWANANFKNRFISRRCNQKDPEQDENGRVIDAACFDANPGTWHIIAVNRLGREKKNFVIDATFDYEVWNQPMYSYSYTYFNPETRKPFTNLDEAKIPLVDFKSDKFGKYRSPETKNIVGVSMRVTYAVENAPHDGDWAKKPTLVTAVYRYDLELADNDDIIGGEWYTNVHPDFLWTPEDGETADGYLDRYLQADAWVDRNESLPEAWRKSAIQSNPYNQILSTVVNALVEESRKPLTN